MKLFCLIMAVSSMMVLAETMPFASGAIFGKAVSLEGKAAAGAWCTGIEGDFLYVGCKGTLSVYDITKEPLRPTLVGEVNGISTARQLAIQNGMVYIVARANGLWIVDCRNPAKPFVAGHYPSIANCTGVDVAGDVCFIGGSRSGLEFIDVADPRNPRLIRSEHLEPVESQSVAYRDGILYSGEWGGKCVSVWDVRDMKAVRRLSYVPLASNGDGVWPDGKWLYACTGWSSQDKGGGRPRAGQMGMEIYDITFPAVPVHVSRVDFEYCPPRNMDMWIPRSSGNLVFCAQTIGGLYAVDVTDKASPKVLDRWKSLQAGDRCVASVSIGDGVVYVAGPGLGAMAVEAKGARRVALRRGMPPVNASEVRPPRPREPKDFHRWLPSDEKLVANVTGLAVRGDICYAAAGMAGLYALGLSNDGITELKRFPLAECMDVSIAGNRLFVAAGYQGFIGYEIVSPLELKEFMRIPNAGARDVYAYGDGTRWIALNTVVYDISDTSQPKHLVNLVNQARWNKFMSPDIMGGRWAAGNSSLKYFGWADLLAANVQETRVKGYKTKGGAICAFGDKAFIADGGKWAIVEPGSVEVPNMKPFPQEGVKVGLPRWNSGKLIALSGAGRVAGIWDFSEPDHPRNVRTFQLPGTSDAASFWRETLVFPARLHGVLLPK